MTTPMKLLVAYDGSPCADEALDDLQRAGLPHELEAVVLSVADLWFLPGGEAVTPHPLGTSTTMQEARATAAAMLDAAKARAASASERLRAQFPGWHIKTKTVADSPAWAIVLEAENWHADLVVVGSHGYSRLSRWILGSVSQTVLTQAPCSVRIARGRRSAPNRPLRILVGVDGSSEADLAVAEVAKRNWPPNTDIRIVMVLDPSTLLAINESSRVGERVAPPVSEEAVVAEGGTLNSGGAEFETMDADMFETGDMVKRVLDRYSAMARQNQSEATISAMIMAGDPKRVLLEEAEQWGADAIFIGSRGLNRWERLLLGSVSTAVATRAHCPVEVVRAARPLVKG